MLTHPYLVLALLAGLLLTAGTLRASPAEPWHAWYDTDALARELSQLAPGEIQRLRETGRVEVRPVALPRPDQVVTGNDYFDWPVATKIGRTIIVLFDRRRYHWGGEEGEARVDANSGIRMITRSTDGGRTWSEPIDVVAEAGRWSRTLFGGWGGGLGVHDGVVYLALNEGLYHSGDRGASWRLVAGEPDFSAVPHEPVPAPGLEAQNVSGAPAVHAPFWSPGMRITFHEQHGLVLWTTRRFKATGRDGRTNDHYGKALSALHSPDFGATWHVSEQALPEGLYLSEVTPLPFGEGELAFFFRNGIRGSRYGQGYAADGWFPFQFTITDIGPVDLMDTPDLVHNPVTGRLEAIAPFRNFKAPIELRLYSIDPHALARGSSSWRFDGVLLRYDGPWGVSDGFNPVGGVIDLESGRHHFHVWAGHPKRRAGIFQVSRSLETDRLREVLLEAGAPEAP